MGRHRTLSVRSGRDYNSLGGLPLVFRLSPFAFRLRKVERVMGIEPTYSAWEADVLPLNYTRFEDGFYDASGDDGVAVRQPSG